MNSSLEAARPCFLPLLGDSAATDRDEDALPSPHHTTSKSTPTLSKLRERSVYADPPVSRSKPRRRPRSLSSTSNSIVNPSDRLGRLDSPLQASQIDLSAVLEACRGREGMQVGLPPLVYQSTTSIDDSLSHPETASPTSKRLPPLELRVLHRQRLILPVTGFTCSSTTLPSTGSFPSIGVEETIQLHELSPTKSPPRSQLEASLRLTILPKKCLPADEVALMPCHSLAHRGLPELAAELWKEPLRDRDKDWQRDDLAIVLASADVFAARRRRGIGMTVVSSTANRGKWRRWEEHKLRLKPVVTIGEAGRSRRPQVDGVLLRNYGAMISNTYCLASIYGVGLTGRMYDAGVSQREQLSAANITTTDGQVPQGDTNSKTSAQQRYLRLEAYDPSSSRVFKLNVTLTDLSWAFHSHPELLIPGRKLALLRELVALLYFDYPSLQDHELLLTTDQSIKTPVLCLAQERRLSEAARRRMERDARLLWEEQQRLLALAAFMKLPRRARHRLACKTVKLSGRTFIVSVYHLPAQVHSFAVVAYHPQSSTSYRLSVGVTEVAVLAKVLSLPHTWTADQRRSLAESVVPRLRFKGTKTFSDYRGVYSDCQAAYSDYRAALAVDSDRQGPWAAPGWLPPLDGLETDEVRRQEMMEKRQRDARRALEMEAAKESDRIRIEGIQRGGELEKVLAELETRRAALVARDVELAKQIEDIDSRGGAGSTLGDLQSTGSSENSTVKVHHELRRAHKAARKALKAEMKAVGGLIADRRRELQLVHDQEELELGKQQRRLKLKLERLHEQNNLGFTIPKPRASDGDVRFSQSRSDPARGQRTWLSRGVIRGPDATLLASGACILDGIRLRYLVYTVGDYYTSGVTSIFRLELYENESSQSVALDVSRLDWIALTKESTHDQQLRVAELAISTSPVVQRVQELDSLLTGLQYELATLSTGQTQAKNSRKASTVAAKTLARRRELMASITELSQERRRYSRLAPWNAVVQALCDRLRLVREPSSCCIDRVELDRCLFRAILPIISLPTDDEDEDDAGGLYGDSVSPAPVMNSIARRASTTTTSGDGQVVYCHVRALLRCEELVFEVFEPLGRQTWRLVYPECIELVKELATNSFMELQMHIEAVAMTMVFFVSSSTGQAELRFED